VNRVLDTIGNTPLVELQQLSSGNGVRIFAKCGFINPSGSLKNRMAMYSSTRPRRDEH